MLVDRNGELAVWHSLHPVRDRRWARDGTFVDIYPRSKCENLHHPHRKHEPVAKRKPTNFFLRLRAGTRGVSRGSR